MNEISVEIKKHFGVLKKHGTGWCREFNLVSWNGEAPKYDIRDWSPDHQRMTRGITLTASEGFRLTQLMIEEFSDCFRVCDECKQIMFSGFVINGGDEHYCSEECLHKHYSQEEYLQMNAENDDDNYWTQWD